MAEYKCLGKSIANGQPYSDVSLPLYILQFAAQEAHKRKDFLGQECLVCRCLEISEKTWSKIPYK